MNYLKPIALLLFALLSINMGYGQVAEDEALYITLKEKDSVLFNAAFNSCDTETVKALFTEDFEFYHDKGGITDGRQEFIDQLGQGCANRKAGEPQPAKRILIPNSLEVFPLYKNGDLYGAIQHGIHRFEFLNDKKEYQRGDIAKFTHVWIKENEIWKVKRELSYDHKLQTEQ